MGHCVERVYVGPFVTSLEMAGFSISLLPLGSASAPDKDDVQILELLDAECAPHCAWKRMPPTPPLQAIDRIAVPPPPLPFQLETGEADLDELNLPEAAKLLEAVIQKLMKTLIDHQDIFTKLDQEAGDGDFGVTLTRGAKAVLENLSRLLLRSFHQSSKTNKTNPFGVFFHRLGLLLQSSMGGTSGALYGVFLVRMADALNKNSESSSSTIGAAYFFPTAETWANALTAATEAIAQIGGAKPGDRTMMDALVPASEAFHGTLRNGGSGLLAALEAAAVAAETGAEATKDLVPKRGRASYVGERAIGHKDAGAVAVAVIFRTLLEATSKE